MNKRKSLAETITLKQIEEALKRKATKHPDPEVQKKKEDWFRKHVVIMKA